MSISFLPITGCAIGTGMVFSALIRGVAYAPEQEETMFNYTVLGFAFIETFAFMLFGAAGTALFFLKKNIIFFLMRVRYKLRYFKICK